MAIRGDVAGLARRLLWGPIRTAKGADCAPACLAPPWRAPSWFARLQRRPLGPFAGALIFALATAALAGCGGVGSLMVDPALYSGYRCNDLSSNWKSLLDREKKLRDLINKARDGGGGTVIGAVVYRSDYETVLAQERVLKQTAAEKNCQLVPGYRSDETIR